MICCSTWTLHASVLAVGVEFTQEQETLQTQCSKVHSMTCKHNNKANTDSVLSVWFVFLFVNAHLKKLLINRSDPKGKLCFKNKNMVSQCNVPERSHASVCVRLRAIERWLCGLQCVCVRLERGVNGLYQVKQSVLSPSRQSVWQQSSSLSSLGFQTETSFFALHVEPCQDASCSFANTNQTEKIL